MKKLISALSVALALGGCVNTELHTAGKQYDPATDARIRLYGQNGRPTTMIVDPNGKAEKVLVGGSVGQAFSSMLHMKGNESIGMPQSEFSRAPERFNNIASGAFYKEFIIPADVDIEVKNTIDTPPHTYYDVVARRKVTTSAHCRSDAIIFKAQAGKDYEVLPMRSTDLCGVDLIELQ